MLFLLLSISSSICIMGRIVDCQSTGTNPHNYVFLLFLFCSSLSTPRQPQQPIRAQGDPSQGRVGSPAILMVYKPDGFHQREDWTNQLISIASRGSLFCFRCCWDKGVVYDVVSPVAFPLICRVRPGNKCLRPSGVEGVWRSQNQRTHS